jgi:hypothetical protein
MEFATIIAPKEPPTVIKTDGIFIKLKSPPIPPAITIPKITKKAPIPRPPSVAISILKSLFL